ncbi:uncharacterized protein LOC122818737 [Drosophila biarmipes]|uniref:uncharacterized protein LOC122818737 n=1 Tax=Drosophila biarmipes TaxID=125945 RepID=UPI001CDB1262|nr:uncharacterized protein LOC122818737 [Drosophila biarmipes]
MPAELRSTLMCKCLRLTEGRRMSNMLTLQSSVPVHSDHITVHSGNWVVHLSRFHPSQMTKMQSVTEDEKLAYQRQGLARAPKADPYSRRRGFSLHCKEIATRRV